MTAGVSPGCLNGIISEISINRPFCFPSFLLSRTYSCDFCNRCFLDFCQRISRSFYRRFSRFISQRLSEDSAGVPPMTYPEFHPKVPSKFPLELFVGFPEYLAEFLAECLPEFHLVYSGENPKTSREISPSSA